MDHSDLTPRSSAGKRRAAPETGSIPLPAAPARSRPEPVSAVTHVPPLDADGVRSVAVGTVLWAVALVALLPFYGWLDDTGRVWWLWTCCAGVGLGLIGLDVCLRRRARAREEAAARLGAATGRRRRTPPQVR